MRILIIGWDGATWDYIEPLLTAGALPNLAALLKRGTKAVLQSTVPPYTNVAWPSLVTGLSPCKTGVFDGVRAKVGSYHITPTNLTGFKGIPIWQWVNAFGLSAAVLNVPVTYPARPLNGYMVTGFDSPVDASDIAYPSDIIRRWARAGHPYRILNEEIALMAEQNPHQPRGNTDAFTRRWVELILEQGDMVAWLLRAWPTDVMFVVFSGTDSINHRTCSRKRIAQVYRAADEALGRILQAVTDDPLVCLISDHGSTPAYRYIALNSLFYKAGWLQFRPEIAPQYWRRLLPPVGRWLGDLWQRLPARTRRLFSRPLLDRDPRLAVAYENIDWERTRVFVRSGLGPLYINSKERYPQGTVAGNEVEAFRSEVISRLEQWRDEEGNRLFGKIWPGDVVYPNAQPVDDPPDLVVTPARWTDHLITGYPSDPIVRPISDADEYGTHTPWGIFAMAGQGIRADTTLNKASIVDVVPTLLALLGLPLPDNMDGCVLQEAFAEPVEVRYEPATVDENNEADFTIAESEEVLKRLRSLGYL